MAAGTPAAFALRTTSTAYRSPALSLLSFSATDHSLRERWNPSPTPLFTSRHTARPSLPEIGGTQPIRASPNASLRRDSWRRPESSSIRSQDPRVELLDATEAGGGDGSYPELIAAVREIPRKGHWVSVKQESEGPNSQQRLPKCREFYLRIRGLLRRARQDSNLQPAD